MNCNEVQNELLMNNGNAGIEAKEHLTDCAECRNFAWVLAMSGHIAEDSMVDANIRNVCREGIRRKRVINGICRYLRTFNYAAAAILLCLGIWQYLPVAGTGMQRSSQPAAMNSATAQIAISQPEECENNWRNSLDAWNEELNLMENNLTLLACGY